LAVTGGVDEKQAAQVAKEILTVILA